MFHHWKVILKKHARANKFENYKFIFIPIRKIQRYQDLIPLLSFHIKKKKYAHRPYTFISTKGIIHSSDCTQRSTRGWALEGRERDTQKINTVLVNAQDVTTAAVIFP